MLHIRNRVFSDIVECQDDRIAGTNEPVLDIDIDTKTGVAELQGRFNLVPSAKSGSWQGEVRGHISGGLVTALGIATGTGAMEGAVLQVNFRQVTKLSTPAPCADPKAFFEMDGWILDRERV
jgi:hypothetical protein